MTSPFIQLTSLSALALSTLMLSAKITQSNRKEAWSIEQELAGFELPDGFIIELVASERNGLINPIDLTFDDAGRLWTQTASMYPLDPVSGQSWGQTLQMMKDPNLGKKYPKVFEIQKLYRLEKRGEDKILIVEDPTKTADGNLTVWADGLTIPQSIMPYKNGAYVAHGSEFFFLSDENNDGKQDKVTPVLSGFGFFDTHTMSHSIVRGPGGWFHFSQGALNSGMVTVVKSGEKKEISYCKNLKLSADGRELEVINCGRDNVWGYQVLANGQWYATSANDNGYSILPMEPQTSINGIGGQMIRDYQPSIPPVNEFRVGGTGISGLAFSEDGEHGFPAAWKDVAILANPITHSLNAVRMVRNPDGTITSQHLPDLLKSKDDWFRPVNIEFGPDGCLYVADWYNKIVGHNEIRTDHPDRDHEHGRIWRIRHKTQKPLSVPNVAKAGNADLLAHLNGKTIWEKRAAWHQIVDRGAKELIPQLKAIVGDASVNQSTRILALWSLEGLKSFDEAIVKAALVGEDDDIRREAIRSLASYDLAPQKVAELVKPYLNDANVMVRSQVLRTLDEIKVADESVIALLVEASKPAAEGNALGGSYERNFERFLARKALERYQDELKTFLTTADLSQFPAENILWAIQAFPANERVSSFLAIWEKASSGKIDPSTFAAITKMLHDPLVRKAVAPTFKSRSQEMLKLALENLDRIDGPQLASFYTQQIEAGLNANDPAEVQKALNLTIQLRSPHHTKTILKHTRSKGANSRMAELLTALGNDLGVPFATYRELFYREDLNFQQRLTALAACTVKNEGIALQDAKKWIPHLSEGEKTQLVTQLSYTSGGNNILKHLWEISYVATEAWSYDAANRTLLSNQKDVRGTAILAAAKIIEVKAQAKRQEDIKRLTKAAATLKGDPLVGQGLFGSCLACHGLAGKGQEIAPALDGSANRELEHLLTAIVDPDAAVEGAYGLYHVVRKDGSFIEGFLVKNDANGITIANQGGVKSFVAKANILSHGGVNSRSFMAKTFGLLPDQVIIDLVTYIKTLK